METESDLVLSIGGWFLLRNEGITTALVTLPSNSAESDAARDTSSFGAMIQDAIPRLTSPRKIELQPDSKRRLYCEMRRPLKDWIDFAEADPPWNRKNGCSIHVTDNFKDGIADMISYND